MQFMNNECISITLRKKNELAPPLGVIGRICYEQYVPADFFIKLSNRLQWMELHPFNSLPSIKFPSRGTCARKTLPPFFSTLITTYELNCFARKEFRFSIRFLVEYLKKKKKGKMKKVEVIKLSR